MGWLMTIWKRLDRRFFMKYIPGLVILAVVWFLTGCFNPQKEFCEKAVSELCGRCESCGNDFRQCGLKEATNRGECESTLLTVCAAYDAEYKKEISRTCLEELRRLSCVDLKGSGKPEVCSRLF